MKNPADNYETGPSDRDHEAELEGTAIYAEGYIGEGLHDIDALIIFLAKDPTVISFKFSPYSKHPMLWDVSRELVALSLEGHFGLGDIQLQPVYFDEHWQEKPASSQLISKTEKDEYAGLMLRMDIESPDGKARIYLPYSSVDTAIRSSYLMTSLQQEAEILETQAEEAIANIMELK